MRQRREFAHYKTTRDGRVLRVPDFKWKLMAHWSLWDRVSRIYSLPYGKLNAKWWHFLLQSNWPEWQIGSLCPLTLQEQRKQFPACWKMIWTSQTAPDCIGRSRCDVLIFSHYASKDREKSGRPESAIISYGVHLALGAVKHCQHLKLSQPEKKSAHRKNPHYSEATGWSTKCLWVPAAESLATALCCSKDLLNKHSTSPIYHFPLSEAEWHCKDVITPNKTTLWPTM